jgi:hypothetical protein
MTGPGGNLDPPVSMGVSKGAEETAGHTADETGSGTISGSVVSRSDRWVSELS